jgi:glucokinase
MILGIDIGGTNLKAVLLTKDYVFVDSFSIPTQENDPHWQENVLILLKQIEEKWNFHPKYLGISAPGIPNEENSTIAFMPGRLAGIENFDWNLFLGKNVYVLNDANAAMMTESRIGAAQGIQNGILITLGTGMGGSILIDRKIYTGMGQKGGHLGHISVLADDPVKGITGQPGNIEEAIGNCSILRRSEGRYQSTEELVKAYESGDLIAAHIWLKSLRYLAIALAGLANVLSPEIIIIGGGITKAGESLLTPLKSFYNEYEWKPGITGADLVFAMHGAFAGAIGAAIFAHEKQNGWI